MEKCPACGNDISVNQYFGDGQETLFNCPRCTRPLHLWTEYVPEYKLSELYREDIDFLKKNPPSSSTNNYLEELRDV